MRYSYSVERVIRVYCIRIKRFKKMVDDLARLKYTLLLDTTYRNEDFC